MPSSKKDTKYPITNSSDITSLHNWNEYQATIYTWGTVPRRNGFIQAALHKLSGRNVGHTAIKLRFPADKRGKELINKYLKSNTGEKITYKKTPSYYEVYFSVWPSESSSIYNSNFARDLYYENQGIPFNYNRNGTAYLTEELQHSYIRNWTMKSDFSFLHFFNRFNKKITLPPLFTYNTNFIEKLSKFGEKHGEIERLNLKKILDDLNETAIEIKELHEESYKLKSECRQLIDNLSLKERKELLDLLDIININEYLLRKHKIKAIFYLKKEQLEIINKKIGGKEYSQKIQQLFKNLETILNYKHEGKHREYKFLNLYKINLNKYPLDQFISIGKRPDNECYLPIVDKGNSKYINSNVQGLDLEEMLKEMVEITSDRQAFGLLDKNCSSTVLGVIYAGINREMRDLLGEKLPKIKNYLNGKSRLFKILNSSRARRLLPKSLIRVYNKTRIFTPQGIYNIANKLEEKLAHKRGVKMPLAAIKKLVKPVKFTKFIKLLDKLKRLFENANKCRENNSSERFEKLNKLFESFTSIVPSTDKSDDDIKSNSTTNSNNRTHKL